ncbi:MAG TPA: hypothetical protein VH062_20150 [Polyangiaceae bacterium]|nr:hypothetical protein [Polyangiaceae bacterium]
MVKPSHLLGLGATVGVLLGTTIASAGESLNPVLNRLVLDHRCNASGLADGSTATYLKGGATNVGQFNDDPATRQAYTNATGRDTCVPDIVRFKQLVNLWGFALAPTAMHSARTVGFGGFQFSIEAVYTKIDSGADYWKLGSEGGRDPSSDKASSFNSSPPGVIQTYSLRVRKAFGFGLEASTQVGYVPSTTLLTGGADLRMALLEGFRTGVAGIFPDVSVGAGVRTITGTEQLQLTTVGLDVQLSKPLPLAGQSVLTPWIGYQYLWIFGDSGLIDTTPATDAVGYCGSKGSNLPGTPDPSKNVFDGQPVCAGGGSPVDYNNNVVFSPAARLERQRIMFGVDYRYEVVTFGAEFITDLIAPADAQAGSSSFEVPGPNGRTVVRNDKDALAGVPRQWSMVLQLGVLF